MSSSQDETRALLAAIVESSEDAIISKTLTGTIKTWNRGAQKIFGYTAEEAVGQHITLIIPPERYPEEIEILSRICRGERVDHFETVRIAKDGTRLDISLTVSPVRDLTGRVIGASKIARDISYRKQIERDRERLLDLEQASRKRLADAVAARDEFIAVAAHELRNPLNVFHLTLQLLHRISTDARVVELVEKSKLQLGRLNTLVDRLLDVTRIRSGNFELYREHFDLSALIREIAARFGGEPFAIPFRLELDNSVAGTWDRLRIDQILTNLISNAIKYGRNKPITISACVSGSDAVVRVRDEGSGISADDLPRIFDRFERVSPQSGGEGLGLGLWIARRIVEAHGGTLSAESELGRGSTFTVRLPIEAEAREGAR